MARWSFSSVFIYTCFRVCPWRLDDSSHKHLSHWQKGIALFFLFTKLTEAIAAELRRIASLWPNSGRFREREVRRKLDPQNRDKNIDYCIAKLDELVKKFGGLSVPTGTQEMLAL